ncbi:MAG TPA: hypothetical protein PLU58_11010 [Saprospiraceae bacterium]|nr:hypothetical protein [Saprospiraceae bacterium]
MKKIPHKITVVIPSVHTILGLRKFNLPFKNVGDGSYIAQDDFNSLDSAKYHLMDVALDHIKDPKKLSEAIGGIEINKTLTIDSIKAEIKPSHVNI